MDTHITHDAELLNCPCCGGTPQVIDLVGVWNQSLLIECPVCGLRTAASAYYTEYTPLGVERELDRPTVYALLKLSWNQRTPPPDKPRRRRRAVPAADYVPVYQRRSLCQ